MNDTCIPKQLFMIWLGDNVPNYAQFSANAYKKANPDFDVQLIHFNIQQIEQLHNKRNANGIELVLQKSIDFILDKSNLVQDSEYVKLYKNQLLLYMQSVNFYKRSVRFIQLLSDIFRQMLIDTYGGIYVDCDTFPLKPFDDKLLQLKRFNVTRHYDNIASDAENNIGNDNYFLGSIQNANGQKMSKLLQTKNKWWANLQYIIDRKKYFDLRLEYLPRLDQPMYITHFCDGNWKCKNGRIRTQVCSLDKLI